MNKLLLMSITGMLLITVLLMTSDRAYARYDEDDFDCYSTMYSKEFRCTKEGVFSYCAPEHKPGWYFQNSIYRQAYCDTSSPGTDDIYERIAIQLGWDDPDLAEFILTQQLIDRASVKSYLDNKDMTFEELHPDVKDALEDDTIDAKALLYSAVRQAYDQERVISGMEEKLANQFKISEKWYSGTLSDSPFDLIVDLNLIEIILFGSKADWTHNVWEFPREEDKKEVEAPPLEEVEEEEAAPPEPTFEPGALTTEDIERLCECVPVEPSKPEEGIPKEDGAPTGAVPPEEERPPAGEEGIPMCWDKEEVTFQSYAPAVTAAIGAPPERPEKRERGRRPPPEDWEDIEKEVCPEGTQLKCPAGVEVAIKEDILKKVVQSPNYDPNIGGTLKKYPPSAKPACPAGHSQVGWVASGEEGAFVDVGLVGREEGPKLGTACLPIEPLCMEPKHIGDEVSIEAVFCVEIEEINRPESPYSETEGCIDCQFAAMIDVLDELLAKNITPLQNTQNAHAGSSRWGPSFALNMETAIKTMLKPKLDQPKTAAEQTNDMVEGIQAKAGKDPTESIVEPNLVNQNEPPIMRSQRHQEAQKKYEKLRKETLKDFRINSNTYSTQQFYAHISPLLAQWHQSFKTLMLHYTSIANGLEFTKKDKCSF